MSFMLEYIETIILGVSLALDACIVAFSYGLYLKTSKILYGVKLATITSLFQYLMPIIGWYIMSWVNSGLSVYYAGIIDHWIAFIVFLLLGSKIIKDSTTQEDSSRQIKLSFFTLLFIGFVTSIDALAAGVMIFVQNINLWISALLIGIITFLLVLCSYVFSKTFSKLPAKYLEISAGVILILLGCKILAEHLYRGI